MTLSVSSNGSRPLQRLHFRDIKAVIRLFQYPQTDRGRCNALLSRDLLYKEVPFSILKRIEAAATPGTLDRPRQIKDFQYPQTDRGRCNFHFIVFGHTLPPLSVSSNGSRPLQRLASEQVAKEVLPFQYPQTDRGRCNAGIASLAGSRW